MKFERLRLSGFKTFVEPVELAIAPGLTGIVGPNGCGKSNLVEALRWAMGETSSRALRGGGMEDVIFAGSATRPERQQAEVSLRLAEPPADLPAAFAGAEVLEISRRIVRAQGSTYRINGREVRARDVQILFADAASGARSPSLVRQGQIAEIIAAKPQHRRRILEDAAGVAGLHTRRHEAELRLKAAGENLARLGDILLHYERQRADLRRQSRSAERYRQLSEAIRALEIRLMAAGLAAARAEAAEAESARDTAIRAEGQAIVAQGETERRRALAEHEAEAATRAASEAQAALAAQVSGRATLDAELAHVRARLEEIARRLDEAGRDARAAEQRVADAVEANERLTQERAALAIRGGGAPEARAPLAQAVETFAYCRAEAEAALATAQQAVAEAQAERRAAERHKAEAGARAARLDAQAEALAREMAALSGEDRALAALPGLEAALAEARAQAERCAEAHEKARQATLAARALEQAARPGLAEAERLFQRLDTEARTIRKLVDNSAPGLWTPAVDRITVTPGYERALAAALGEDLDAAIEPGAPRHWAAQPRDALPALPEGAEPLLDRVEAPGALHARLSQIGVVAADQGEWLAPLLRPGQRLVSPAGDLWRWDGFSARADAPGAAARRLEERNRLGELEAALTRAKTRRDSARGALDSALAALRRGSEDESQAREAERRAVLAREAAERGLAQAHQASQSARLRLESLRLRHEEAERARLEARADAEQASTALASLPPVSAQDPLAVWRATLAAARESENAARAALSRHDGEAALTEERHAALARDLAGWRGRADRAREALADLDERRARLLAEQAGLIDQPDALSLRRLHLSDSIARAQAEAAAAGDAQARAQGVARQAGEAARAALAALAEARAETGRREARHEAAALRLAEITRGIEARLEAPVETLPAPGEAPVAALETELETLRGERERLGAVNLRAEMELCEIEKEHARLEAERVDVEKAIARLRRAIETLNSEARTRLHAAFEQVDSAFRALFSRLFGGGTARLELVEAQDPLEAGLEILAHPPGKRAQLLSLLSGGEQALTATALIFAVFLTNPAPICVLDEVDAPLDDANVERLCDLVADIAARTGTRFLTITHNPITMARMDRLYGVTMVEKGVSQVVSVDLSTASALAEAG